ncbi:MAG: LytR family transcriptional regulator [Caldilinea sp. CFX5]|nr:LytR family transcriptional regulator [Caldilinea sp. CFX5]
MSHHPVRRLWSALLLCALLVAQLPTNSTASSPQLQTPQVVPPQPTPPANGQALPHRSPNDTKRPYPVIIPRLLAPPLTKHTVVAAPATPVWEEPVGPADKWVNTDNYLILGTDRRAGTRDWRTDTIMIVGLDRERGRAAVFSIPRDLYLEIPNYGYGRINQADFLGERNPSLYGGGPQLVSQIISKTFGIQINHWVRFQMDGFIRVVDAVGGVTVHLDCPFYEPIFNLTSQSWEFFTLPAGDNQLDGESAYWFVRLRLRESDIGRSARQRQFLWALRDKMLSAKLITRFPELWGAFQDSFSTDLSLVQLVELTSFGLSLNADNVHAGGLTLAELQNYRTEQGAAVLQITNPGRIRAVVNGVWEGQSMAGSYRKDPAKCPPIPQGAPIVDTVTGVTTTAPVTTTIAAGDPITTTGN